MAPKRNNPGPQRVKYSVKQVGYERAKVYGLYLAACELNFELNGIQVHQFLAVKPDKEGLPKGNWYPLRPWWAA